MALISDRNEEAYDAFSHLMACRDPDCHWCADRPSDDQIRQQRIADLFAATDERAA